MVTGLKPSLRIIVAVIIAVVILIVAALTLSITYVFSLNAIRDIGKLQAFSLAEYTQFRVDRYISGSQDALQMVQTIIENPHEMFVLPSDDRSADWDLKWGLPIQTMLQALNYTPTSISVVTEDGSIVTVALSAYAADAGSYVAVNGRTLLSASSGKMKLGTGTLTRNFYWSTKTQAVLSTNPSQAPEITSLGDQRNAYYWQALSSVGSQQKGCTFLQPTIAAAATNPLMNPPRFVLFGACTLYNASRQYLGQVNMGVDLSYLNSFITDVGGTPNTAVFIVDQSGFLLATTQPQSYFQYWTASSFPGATSPSLPPGCSNSSQTGSPNYQSTSSSAQMIIACRKSTQDYGYAPLAQQSHAFIHTPSAFLKDEEVDGESYLMVSNRLRIVFGGFNLNLLVFLPELDLINDIIDGRNISIGVTVAVAIVACFGSAVLVGLLLGPLHGIAESMLRTSRLETEDRDRVGDSDTEFGDLTDTTSGSKRLDNRRHEQMNIDAVQYEDEDGNKRTHFKTSKLQEIAALQVAFMTMDNAIQSFTRYVPRDVVKDLVSSGELCQIAMKPQRCTMLFIDIAGFTTLCEQIPAPILSKLIRLYFERTSRLVMGHGGIIDKFIGDCIFAVWGAPFECNHQELRASLCARSLHHETTVDPLQSEFVAAGTTLSVRVGVATGDVLAGNMGSAERMNYTVIGDAVNLAARLESLNKQWGTGTMLSDDTADEVQRYLTLRLLVVIAVVGKEDPVAVYEIMGVSPTGPEKVTEGRNGNDASSAGSGASTGNASVGDASLANVDINHAFTQEDVNKTSVNKLLKRGRRKFLATPEQVKWANTHSAAVNAFRRADFAQTVQMMEGYNDETSTSYLGKILGPIAAEHTSTQKIMSRCRQYLEMGCPNGFDGVIVAEEK